MTKIIARKRQTSDALVSTETVMRTFRKDFTSLINNIQKEWSLSEKQAVAILLETLEKAKPGDFIGKALDN